MLLPTQVELRPLGLCAKQAYCLFLSERGGTRWVSADYKLAGHTGYKTMFHSAACNHERSRKIDKISSADFALARLSRTERSFRNFAIEARVRRCVWN